ncbi:MAG: DUF6249 domain-containing protein [Inhella sp.]
MESDIFVLKHILPFMIPIVALLIPIVAIVAHYVSKSSRERAIHETVRQLSAAGQPIPPQLLDGSAFRSEEAPSASKGSPHYHLRAGAVNLAVGLGLAGMFFVMRPSSWLWAIGLIPLCLGAAFLVLWKYESKHPA